MSRRNRLLQVKISLDGIAPPIWRRVLVSPSMNLRRSHGVLQKAMGWEDAAPYVFEGDGQQMGPLDRAPPGMYLEDDRTYLVRHWLCQPGHALAYRYDFDDDWRHTIAFERIIELEPGHNAQARCIDGARACPPEHCGGTAGYQALVEAWFDPLNPAHEATRDFLGCVGLGPDKFDVEEADRRMRGGRPPRIGELRTAQSRTSLRA